MLINGKSKTVEHLLGADFDGDYVPIASVKKSSNLILRWCKFLFKKRIFKVAQKIRCDLDGDIMIYHGRTYFIHIFNNTCVKTQCPMWLHKIRYPKRWFITGRETIKYIESPRPSRKNQLL